MRHHHIRRSALVLLGAALSLLFAATAGAQEQAEAEPEGEIEEIVVVGTQIKGARVNDILPISVLGEEDIELTGALSGDELFRNLPEVGDATFNSQKTSGGVNDARGDTASINLRSFGTGNTLLLLNGRRLVNHPGYQTEELVPVVTPNTNAIPVLGVRRIEVLRDGASAIYGADAVAGVINTVLKQDFEGLTVALRGRDYDEISRNDFSGSLEYGWRSASGKSSVSVFAHYYDRDRVPASDRARSRSRDLRPFVAGTPFENNDWRGTSVNSPWGSFDIVPSVPSDSPVRDITASNGRFHIQPLSNSGCRTNLPPGAADADAVACIDDNDLTGSGDENLRFNWNADATFVSELERQRVLIFGQHELTPDLELFGEVSYYAADTTRVLYPTAALSSARPVVPKENYWNPFGARLLPDGTPNPNRLDINGNGDFTDDGIPDEGFDITLRRYRVMEPGPRVVEVESETWRWLAGLRGVWQGWDWESAVSYSDATADDITQNRVSNTLFQRALGLTTPEAYNPFNGGGALDCYNQARDCEPSAQTTVDGFTIDVFRKGNTNLFTADLRVSNPDLLELPAGPLGIALGVEWRQEEFEDDRDPRLDGSITYYDPVSGTHRGVTCADANGMSTPPADQSPDGGAPCPAGTTRVVTVSDVMNSSPTPDGGGDRDVLSGYLELAIPLVGEAWDIPLAQSVDMQLAARYEDFSDVGDIVVPKVALSWRMTDFLMLRGAYSEGFRAPNLVQINERIVSRVNTRDDFYLCQLDLLGPDPDLDDCPSYGVQRLASGSDQLVPEESQSRSFGIVLDPSINTPWGDGDITFTVDWWAVRKDGTIGIFGEVNHILLDTLIRLENTPADLSDCGSVVGNPAVIRATDLEDEAEFLAAGLCPVGEVLQVRDQYVNLNERTIEGFDFGLYIGVDTAIGEFDYKLNAARINRFFQAADARSQRLLDAQGAGTLQALLPVQGVQELVQRGETSSNGGRPEWQLTSSLRWRLNDWGAGVRVRHVGAFYDQSADTSDGRFWEVEEWTTYDADVYYNWAIAGLRTRLRLGITNLTNEDAPLADESYGYWATLHNNLGRSIYFDVRVKF